MENEHNRYITKKIGVPRMILTLLGIMIIGIGAAWFGKNQKTGSSSEMAQDTRKDLLSTVGNQPADTEKTQPSQQDQSESVLNSQSPQKEVVSEIPFLDTKIVGEKKNVEKSIPEQKKQATAVEGQKPVKQEVVAPSQPVVFPSEKSTPQKETPVAVEEQKPSQPTVVPPLQPVVQKKEFADGTYSARGFYISPAGGEEVNVSLTLKDTTITSAEFTGKAENPTSRQWQNIFKDGYREKVIGKPIKELSLTVVSGSSLTPKGFMDALEKIKQQASNS